MAPERRQMKRIAFVAGAVVVAALGYTVIVPRLDPYFAVRRMLASRDPAQRDDAVRLLSGDPSDKASAILADMLLRAPEDADRRRTLAAIGRRTDRRSVLALVSAAVVEPSPPLRQAIGEVLARHPDPLCRETIIAAAKREDLPVVAGAWRFFLEADLAMEYKDVVAKAYVCCGTDPAFGYSVERWGLAEFDAAVRARRGALRRDGR
jgi:hypothetical protein